MGRVGGGGKEGIIGINDINAPPTQKHSKRESKKADLIWRGGGAKKKPGEIKEMKITPRRTVGSPNTRRYNQLWFTSIISIPTNQRQHVTRRKRRERNNLRFKF